METSPSPTVSSVSVDTVLIVFPIAFFIMANQVAMERFHPLGIMVRAYQYCVDEKTKTTSLGFVEIGDFWMACFLSFVLAYAIGLGSAWLERRRGWDIAAVFRGALIGFGIAAVSSFLTRAAWGGKEPTIVLRESVGVLGNQRARRRFLGLIEVEIEATERGGRRITVTDRLISSAILALRQSL